jgi:hypothetical protein
MATFAREGAPPHHQQSQHHWPLVAASHHRHHGLRLAHLPQPPPRPRRPAPAAGRVGDSAAPSAAPPQKLRVCTNRTCRRQGSDAIHRFAIDLALPGLEVEACGCLGLCGAGPNVALLDEKGGGGEEDEEVVARHVATPAALVSLLTARWRLPPAEASNHQDQGSFSSSWPEPLSKRHLEAVRARLAGNAAAVDGQLDEALALYRGALRLLGEEGEEEDGKPPPPASLGAHLVRSNMSAALLQMGRAEEAAAEAQRAERGAPRAFCTAAVRLVDALYALAKYEDAGRTAVEGLRRHPGLSQRPEWADIRRALAARGVEVPAK